MTNFPTVFVRNCITWEKQLLKRIVKDNVTTPIVESHTPPLKGRRKANMLIGGSPGLCIIRLMLKSINGLLKSMTSSRSAVIVMGASAMSLSYKGTFKQLKHVNTNKTVWTLTNLWLCKTLLCGLLVLTSFVIDRNCVFQKSVNLKGTFNLRLKNFWAGFRVLACKTV